MTAMDLGELIADVERTVPADEPVRRVTEAQNRAHRLTDTGEQLIGHFVAQAKAAGAPWAAIGEALGVSRQAAQQSTRQVYAGYTLRARHAVVLAQEAARAHRHDFIGTEHLMAGVLGEPDGVGAKLIVAHSGTTEAAVAALRAAMPPDGDTAPSAKPPFTPRAKAALEQASRASADLGHAFVGTEHLLLGLLRVDGVAQQALTELGIDLASTEKAVRDEIARLGAEPDPPT